MATSTSITLTEEQKTQLAKNLRVKVDDLPDNLAIVALAPEAAAHMGIPAGTKAHISPALIIT